MVLQGRIPDSPVDEAQNNLLSNKNNKTQKTNNRREGRGKSGKKYFNNYIFCRCLLIKHVNDHMMQYNVNPMTPCKQRPLLKPRSFVLRWDVPIIIPEIPFDMPVKIMYVYLMIMFKNWSCNNTVKESVWKKNGKGWFCRMDDSYVGVFGRIKIRRMWLNLAENHMKCAQIWY